MPPPAAPRRSPAVVVVAVAAVVALGVGAWWLQAGHRPAPSPGPSVSVPVVPVPAGVPATLLAAGDIATCDGAAPATGRLLQEQDGVVAALGDLAYPDGSAAAFDECYDPAWGPVRDRTRPARGNHDVEAEDGAAYRDYFGAASAPWYSYDLGDWHVVVLDSNCHLVGGCGPDSPQVRWLRDDLAGADTGNILAYWHAPRFSTGRRADSPSVATFWEELHAAGADVVLAGHAHNYQRFVPLAPDGTPDPDGIRQFVVGTGGAALRGFETDRDTVAHRQADVHGVLRLDLRACGYAWAFLPVGGGGPTDEGAASGTC